MEEEKGRCLGCLIGAWVGDAIGGVLEFSGVPSQEAVSHAFSMPGGGVHHLGRGQVTDDSEMGMSLFKGLLAGNGVLDLNKIALSYGNWFASRPFDVGGTIRKSVGRAVNMSSHQAEMMRRGAKEGIESQSNGCLMRIAPLAVFLRHLSSVQITQAVLQEVALTHANETVQFACVLYVLAITYLLQHPGERRPAYDYAKECVVRLGNEEIKDWIHAIDSESVPVVVNRKSGWAKIALVHAFRSLLGGLDYDTGLRRILSAGGDTDTNACIVGGLLGAADGVETLPQHCIEAVLQWSPKTGGGIKRPKWLWPKENYPLIDAFLALAPRELVVIGGREEYA